MPPKIAVRKKTIVPTQPKTPVGTLAPSLDSILMTVNLGSAEEPRKLSKEQTTRLLSLTYPDGTYILTKDNISLMFDIISMLKKLPYDVVISFILEAATPKQIVLNSPLLESERESVELALNAIQTKIKAQKGVHQCSRCGEQGDKFGWETLSSQKQIRSADEPMSTLVKCLTCGKNWRID